jgi:phosphatidylglycerol:prolipoprotein diacylglycerol transferase
VFPQSGDPTPRHPSQLYQFALEGVLLFVFLWVLSRRQRAPGVIGGWFLIGYATLRIVAEFAREPDNFLGLLALRLTLGQWLSLPLLVVGAWLLWRARRSPP